MGCNCKNDKNKKTGEQKNTEKKSSVFNKVLLIIVKLFLFIIASAIGAVIVIPFTIFLLYKSIFSDSSVDVTNMILSIAKPLKNRKKEKENNEKDENYEKFEIEEDVILLTEEKWYKKQCQTILE